MAYGSFLTITINFIIIAFVLFLAIRSINRLTRKQAETAPPPVPPKQEVLLEEIRDILKARG